MALKPLCSYLQAYIDRYSYEHIPITGAVDEHSNVAFSFHVDKVWLRIWPKPAWTIQHHNTFLKAAFRQWISRLKQLPVQDVTPKKEAYQGQHAAGQAKPTSTLGCAMVLLPS